MRETIQRPKRSLQWGGAFRAVAGAGALLVSAGCAGPEETAAAVGVAREELGLKRLPNNTPFLNPGGLAASYSTQGDIDLTDEYFQEQGTNGRDCSTCHAPQDGWSLRPTTARLWFEATGGTHPLFNIKDADNPTRPVGTEAERRANYTMLLQGKFVRTLSLPATREYEVIAASDPFGYGTTTRLHFFRRPLATANFLAHTVAWDSANTSGTDLRAGLVRQANGNVTGAQEGPPATPEVIDEIVQFELELSFAQLVVPGAGRLDAGGAKGGPRARSLQGLVQGPFDLYDAWKTSGNPFRRQIARGQALFNRVDPANGRSCNGCHNAKNDGQNVNGGLFNVGVSDVQFARADMAVYTLQNSATGEIVHTTDPGRAARSGLWADLNRFKTPSLRGLAARGDFFHNGIAHTLDDVVDLYEQTLGFRYTAQEQADLVAFLNAL